MRLKLKRPPAPVVFARAIVLFIVIGTISVAFADHPPVRVLVWDEQQPEQKEAYDGFLGEAIAAHLNSLPEFEARPVSLYDAEQGVPEELLDFAEVLIWWGHVKHSKIEPATGRKIVERIVDGRLSLIALHSSHWATPFVEAMNERARQNARALPKAEGDHLIISEIPLRKRFYLPKRDEPLTPRMISRKYPDGRVNVDLYLPNCCFPAFRSDGKPSSIHVMKPQHPIVAGLPVRFELPETEMYDEPFHIPEPDVVVLEERWSTGEWFRSGSVWDLGAGKVFYFRPGHETYPVFRQAEPLKIVSNAAKWLAHELRKNGN